MQINDRNRNRNMKIKSKFIYETKKTTFLA